MNIYLIYLSTEISTKTGASNKTNGTGKLASISKDCLSDLHQSLTIMTIKVIS